MSEINVLKGRKFEDCWEHVTKVDNSIRTLEELVLERLNQLTIPVNPNSIVTLANMVEVGNEHYDNDQLIFIERCDLITRTLFNQSLFESTQADIEAEAELRDAENALARATEAEHAAANKYFELKTAYEKRVEEVTQ